ncbi:hypothetical protein SAMN05444422_104141 [Halobiforma haloterrestris]|uniref:MTH865-like family protein n=1 Tax=Natronobacterium haloterrestre TaxID=148448 RepID=A0A1I1G7D7_NATHA|nr:MTH865 family protein [Halobiforma haloterrestris]SFC07607.1 hypothetical protein SAMN05444422_104141 [Halobiforma haloterrestris]
MTEPDVSDIREQLVDAFDGADYPVSTPMDLLPALPNGPATTFESGEFSMSMMQIHSTADVDPKERFPYESPEALADDIIDGLQDAGELPE